MAIVELSSHEFRPVLPLLSYRSSGAWAQSSIFSMQKCNQRAVKNGYHFSTFGLPCIFLPVVRLCLNSKSAATVL